MKIFAVERDLTFDRQYCQTVFGLPFTGWGKYQVYEPVGQDLEFRAEFGTYDEARTYAIDSSRDLSH